MGEESKKLMELVNKAKKGDIIYWNETTGEMRNIGNATPEEKLAIVQRDFNARFRQNCTDTLSEIRILMDKLKKEKGTK